MNEAAEEVTAHSLGVQCPASGVPLVVTFEDGRLVFEETWLPDFTAEEKRAAVDYFAPLADLTGLTFRQAARVLRTYGLTDWE